MKPHKIISEQMDAGPIGMWTQYRCTECGACQRRGGLRDDRPWRDPETEYYYPGCANLSVTADCNETAKFIAAWTGGYNYGLQDAERIRLDKKVRRGRGEKGVK
jgi:hypothetical protein